MKATLTHPDKILFPRSKITKEKLAAYYLKAAPLMLPLIKDRPISMVRYPQGIGEEGFFQKHAPQGLPSWVRTATVEREGESPIEMILCNTKDVLLWLINQNSITQHIWLSRYDKPTQPDRMIFDLDPPSPKRFKMAVDAALALKETLEGTYKLTCFVNTTGSKGLHVVVPIKRLAPFDQVRSFAKLIAQKLVDENPKLFTLESRKIKRQGRLLIDVQRNSKGQTVVAPYSVRALEKAPIATPLFWKELEESTLCSDLYNISNIHERLKTNPWARLLKCSQTLPKTLKKD